MQRKRLSNNEKQKPKMKKNAFDSVDFDSEKKLDPKFKTELCKSWTDNNFCAYGNKCRFAHGKNELSFKQVNTLKYKQKDCNSFKENGWCLYGNRCNFKHDERNLSRIDRSYYSYLLQIQNENSKAKRLPVFKNLTEKINPNEEIDVNSSIIHPDIKACVNKLMFAKFVLSNISSDYKYLCYDFPNSNYNKERTFYQTNLPSIVQLHSIMSCFY